MSLPLSFLVIGASGGTGICVLSTLLGLPSSQVSSVNALYRTLPSTPVSEDPRLKPIKGSVVDTDAIPVEGVDVVIYTASGGDYASCIEVDFQAIGEK